MRFQQAESRWRKGNGHDFALVDRHGAARIGAARIWILNVGDIKPGEVGIEFFTRTAWDIQARSRPSWATTTV